MWHFFRVDVGLVDHGSGTCCPSMWDLLTMEVALVTQRQAKNVANVANVA